MTFKEIEPDLQDIINRISLCAAMLTFLSWSLIRILRPNIINRVSLRFQVVISFIDILRHGSYFDIRVLNDKLCDSIGFFISFSDHIYILLNVLIAMNTHIVFILRKRTTLKFYYIYIISGLLFSLTLNIVTLVNGNFGRSSKGNCFFKSKSDRMLYRVITMYAMEFPGVLYCGLFSILVMFKFKSIVSKFRVFHKDSHMHIDENTEPTKHIESLYWRVSMYPLSCFITILPFLIGVLLLDIGVKVPLWYSFIYRLCHRIPGITNFVFMLYDPNFQIALRDRINYFKLKMVKENKKNTTIQPDCYELQIPSSSEKNEMTWYDQMNIHNDWNIEFKDGHTMSLREHIRFL